MIINSIDIIHIGLAGLFIAIIYSILRVVADANKDLKLQIIHLNNTILEYKEKLRLEKERNHYTTGQLVQEIRKMDELNQVEKDA